MTKKENLFQEHYIHLDYCCQEEFAVIAATQSCNTTLAYHKKCLELILEEWAKGKFQEPLNAIIRREIEELNKMEKPTGQFITITNGDVNSDAFGWSEDRLLFMGLEEKGSEQGPYFFSQPSTWDKPNEEMPVPNVTPKEPTPIRWSDIHETKANILNTLIVNAFRLDDEAFGWLMDKLNQRKVNKAKF